MSPFGQDVLTVSLSDAPPAAVLAAEWRGLEAQSDHSFFTSWSWIGCWLQGLEPQHRVMLLRARRGGRTVGLGLLLGHNGRRLKLLPSRGLYLHATGDACHDELAVEHNGLLVQRDDATGITRAMYGHLLDLPAQWDRLELPGLTGRPVLDRLADRHSVLREESRPSHYVDLKAVRQRSHDYLGMLSASTRSQIRRSLKAYGALGAVTLTEAHDLPTALQYLDRLKALHQAHWQSRGQAGSFANVRFDAFHTRQISESFATGHVQLLRVHAGERDIGYLYNFIHRGQVLFYQSGFDYQLIDKHGRPGLVAHALSIQHNAKLGHTTYDFLAGDTRYKQSLSTGTQPMVWAAVHRDTWAFRLEETLRGIKRALLSPRAPRPKAAAEGLRLYPLVAASVLALMQALTPANSEAFQTPDLDDTPDALDRLEMRRLAPLRR